MTVYSGIGVYDAYAEDDAAEGDEVSSTYEGRHLTFLGSDLIGPNALIQKGDPVVVASGRGDIVGVAFTTQVLAGDLIAIDTEGIWMLEVTATNDFGNSAVVAGDPLFIDTTDLSCVISKIQDPESNTLFGYALGNINAGETAIIAVKVHWGPSLDNIWMGIANNYTTGTTALPRVKIDSDYSGVAGIHRAVWVVTQMTDDSGTNESSLYGARFQAVLPDGCTLTTVGHINGVHGYSQFFGICDDGGAGPTGAAGGVHVGVKGEIYSSGATFTGVRFITGVMGTANLGDVVSAGHYSAVMAYCANPGDTLWADSAYYAWGYFDSGVDLTGCANNAMDAFAFTEGYGALAATIAPGAAVGRLNITISGVQFYIPVWN